MLVGRLMLVLGVDPKAGFSFLKTHSQDGLTDMQQPKSLGVLSIHNSKPVKEVCGKSEKLEL